MVLDADREKKEGKKAEQGKEAYEGVLRRKREREGEKSCMTRNCGEPWETVSSYKFQKRLIYWCTSARAGAGCITRWWQKGRRTRRPQQRYGTYIRVEVVVEEGAKLPGGSRRKDRGGMITRVCVEQERWKNGEGARGKNKRKREARDRSDEAKRERESEKDKECT